MAYPVYSLTVHPSYYNKGYFNLGVEVDRFVRRHTGSCTLYLGDSGEWLTGRVNREANTNRTPRIHAGAKLRDWFHHQCDEMDVVDVVIEASDIFRLRVPND